MTPHDQHQLPDDDNGHLLYSEGTVLNSRCKFEAITDLKPPPIIVLAPGEHNGLSTREEKSFLPVSI